MVLQAISNETVDVEALLIQVFFHKPGCRYDKQTYCELQLIVRLGGVWGGTLLENSETCGKATWKTILEKCSRELSWKAVNDLCWNLSRNLFGQVLLGSSHGGTFRNIMWKPSGDLRYDHISNILYDTVLCYAVLYYTILHYVILY